MKIRLLHLSDIQFGKNHRFGSGAGLKRLIEDLDLLADTYDLRPDALVVTGDLAEWGRKSELEDALEFLERLTEHLDIDRRRVVVVPGNHDVNRTLCRHYWEDCAEEGTAPQKPYWPKFRYYASLVHRFYQDVHDVDFTEEQPWTFFEMPELRLVVAGLNSAMAESHEDHYGEIGREQLDWFFDRLAGYKKKRWFRVGAVHHNVLPGYASEDESLRDHVELKNVLGCSLNLILHGHTHAAEVASLLPDVPILSTGSTGLMSQLRPDVPNQYQIICIESGHLVRWCRQYAPDRSRWIADSRASESGEDWKAEHRVVFSEVQGTFPYKAETPAEKGGMQSAKMREKLILSERLAPRDDFLRAVEEVCRHRAREGAEIRPVVSSISVPYLAVQETVDNIVTRYAVGAWSGDAEEDSLDHFLEIHRRYQRTDPGARSTLVYGGNPPSNEVIHRARKARIRLRSIIEYQGLIDFRPYVKRQTDELGNNRSYPPSLYVDQRMRYKVGWDEHESDKALAKIRDWLLDDHGRFILILGEFGAGKTFLLREIARRLGEENGPLTPIFIELRELEKGRSLNELIAQHFAREEFDRIDFKAFRYMLREGRIVLLFDGFDELVLRVTYDQATEHFETLLEAAGGDAKVVVTSRTQHFESDMQISTALGRRAGQLAGHRIVHLCRFDSQQIRSYLVNRLRDPEAAARRFELIGRIKDLMGLSQVPRMLGFITDLPEQALLAAERKTGGVRAADLYGILLDVWIAHETGRQKPKGGTPTLTDQQRWAAVRKLAIRLWEQTARFVSVRDLVEEAAALEELADSTVSTDVAAQQMGSGTLLVRDSDGAFSFVHQSILEWLVASQAAKELQKKGTSAVLGVKSMSPLMAEFFRDLVTSRTAADWVRGALESSDETIKKNALVVRERLEAVGFEVGTALRLAGQDLRGRNFSTKNLDGADLSRTDLTSSKLVATSLQNACLTHARLVEADLSDAVLRGTDLQNADLERASLLGADLRGANMSGSDLWRTKLVGAKLDEHSLDKARTLGAAMLTTSRIHPWHSMSTACNSVAWCPEREILATGHDDGAVHIWDTVSRKEIRILVGHQAWVSSVCFDHVGFMLASGSYDKTVMLWNLYTGELIETLKGHESWVTSVSFDPGGSFLASGSDDKTVRLWDVVSKARVQTFRGHLRKVTSVCFSPDGAYLASGSDDKTIRIWDVKRPSLPYILKGHLKKVTSVCYSPGGRILASGSEDKTVCLWNVGRGDIGRPGERSRKPKGYRETVGDIGRPGERPRKLRGHKEAVTDVCFDPEGVKIASASSRGTVRVWDTISGQEVRVLRGHRQATNSVGYCWDASVIASGSYDKTVRLWSASSGQEIGTLAGFRNTVNSVCIDHGGSILASGCEGTVVHLWCMKSFREIRRLRGHSKAITDIAFSRTAFGREGTLLASSSDDGTVRLWNASTGETVRIIRSYKHAVSSMSVNSSASLVAMCSFDNAVRLWSSILDKMILVREMHQNVVTSLCFSPGDSFLASGSYDRQVCLCRIAKQFSENPIHLSHTLEGHEGTVLSVCFSPDEEIVASGSEDETVRLWTARNGQELHVLEGHQQSVSSVCFNPQGSLVASGSHDYTVRLWNVESGEQREKFLGHQNIVRSVCFSPDGSLLVSSSDDNSVRIWDVTNGSCLATLVHLPEGWVAYTPDARYKLGGDTSGAFWHSIGLCRFEAGELDPHLETSLRVPDDEPLIVRS